MYIPKTPILAKKIFPKLTWDNINEDKAVYLTFDDGPTPAITTWVLDELKKYNAKATFFCLGKNVKLYPELYQRIKNEEHSIGNHTNNHLNAWKTNKTEYLKNIEKCANVFQSNLFRPPYGKLKLGLRRKILKNYKIIMWDIMTYDFDKTVSPQQCIENVCNHVKPGSIIVMHDSVKAEKNLKGSLPSILKYFSDNNIKMKALK